MHSPDEPPAQTAKFFLGQLVSLLRCGAFVAEIDQIAAPAIAQYIALRTHLQPGGPSPAHDDVMTSLRDSGLVLALDCIFTSFATSRAFLAALIDAAEHMYAAWPAQGPGE
jgi:hypothetical protein